MISKAPSGTDDVGRGLEVDGFTLRQAAPDRQGIWRGRRVVRRRSGYLVLCIGSLGGDA